VYDGFFYLKDDCTQSDDQPFHTPFLFLKDQYKLDECKNYITGEVTKRKLTSQEGIKLLMKLLYNFDGVSIPRFSMSALFAVAKHAILRNPRSYYIRLARELGTENNPFLGFFFERTWPAVFHSKCMSGKVYDCNLDVSKSCSEDSDWSSYYSKCPS